MLSSDCYRVKPTSGADMINGMRDSANVTDMRDTLAILPMLITPALLVAAAWIGLERWRHRVAAWLVILALAIPSFFS